MALDFAKAIKLFSDVGDKSEREKEREGEKKMGDCETFTNSKIACCVMCLFCLGLVVFSVYLGYVIVPKR